MKEELIDGYYLSVYTDIEPLFHIMNQSLRHDHNMTLFKKSGNCIEIVHHWEFERVTGLKHHSISFYEKKDAIQFINQLLLEVSLSITDMQEIIGVPQLATCNDYHSINDIENITYHSICHLFSSMIMDGERFQKETIIALAFDAGSDYVVDKNAYKKNEFCGAVSINGKAEYFPIPSPGPYWYSLTKLCHKPEGTLMALAYATTTKLTIEKPALPDIYTVSDIMEYTPVIMDFCHYVLEYPIQRLHEICCDFDPDFTEQENKISMIMKYVQEESLACVRRLIQKIVDQYNLEPKDTCIALSGGYALNCPTNSYIMSTFGFKKQLCCPCVNDSGMAIGMGLYYFYKKCGSFDYRFATAYYGSKNEDLEQALSQFEPFIKSVHCGLEYAAEDIMEKPVVWFEGRSEVGPRALGHRSILANPAKEESKDLLNVYKQREWWRPVAPIILEEEKANWFEEAFSSPYMLNNFTIKPEKKDAVNAILHLDQTARVQTIRREDNEMLCQVISDLHEATGIPIICNTSLNDKGEPIIEKITEALNFALRKGIRIVYVNGYRIELINHEAYTEDKPLSREPGYFVKHRGDRTLFQKWNPYGLDQSELYIYKINEVLSGFDITSEKDVKLLKKIIAKYKADYELHGTQAFIQ